MTRAEVIELEKSILNGITTLSKGVNGKIESLLKELSDKPSDERREELIKEINELEEGREKSFDVINNTVESVRKNLDANVKEEAKKYGVHFK